MAEVRLLIQPVFYNQSFLSKFGRFVRRIAHLPRQTCRPIQGKIFRYGISVKNIGDTVLDTALIKNITIRSASNSTRFFHNSKKEYSLDTLNPQEEQELPFEEISSHLSGTLWISLDVLPSQVDTIITTFQKIGNVNHDFSIRNAWGTSFLIDSRFDAGQEQTNALILTLTILTFVDGVWGLKVALDGLLKAIKAALEFGIGIINHLL